MTSEHELRKAVISTALGMNIAGINRGKAGNVSVRLRRDGFDGFLVTPSGLPYADTAPDDVVAMTLDGEAHGERVPSSEWRFHRDIYQARPEVGAIVHTHSPFATTLACLDRGIPPFHYMIAVAGGKDVLIAGGAEAAQQYLKAGLLDEIQLHVAPVLLGGGTRLFDTLGPDDAKLELTDAVESSAVTHIKYRVLS